MGSRRGGGIGVSGGGGGGGGTHIVKLATMRER